MASVSRVPLIKSSTMSTTIAQKAVATSLEAIEAHSHKDIAISIRKVFQTQYPTMTWHCFVGRDLVSSQQLFLESLVIRI